MNLLQGATLQPREAGAIEVLRALVRHYDLAAAATPNKDRARAIENDATLAKCYADSLEKGMSLDKLLAISETFNP